MIETLIITVIASLITSLVMLSGGLYILKKKLGGFLGL